MVVVVGLRLQSGDEVPAAAVVVAPGHSARDVQRWLRAAGVRLVVAESFERIYRQNADNLGLLTSTDLSLPARLLAGEVVDLEELLQGRFEATRTEELVGKVTTAPAVVGEQVLAAKVTTYEGQAGLAYKIPEGMRALSLQVPHEAWIAAGLVLRRWPLPIASRAAMGAAVFQHL